MTFQPLGEFQPQLSGGKKEAGQSSSSPWDLHMPDFPLTLDANPGPLAVLLPHL